MVVSHIAFHLTVSILVSGVSLLSALSLRGLESPIESGSDVIIKCEGNSADVKYMTQIHVYGKWPGEAERRLVIAIGTLAGVKKNWDSNGQTRLRGRAEFTAKMTAEQAFITLTIRNLTCSDNGMLVRCKVVGVNASATAVARVRVQAHFSRLSIDGGEFECNALTSHSQRMRIACNGCDRAAIRGKSTSFSCWGDIDANLRANFSISWYRTPRDKSLHQRLVEPLKGVMSDLATNDIILVPGQNGSECQFSTLKSKLEYRLSLEEQDMDITCEISGPAEQGGEIYAKRTLKLCAVAQEDVPMKVVVIPQSIVADIGNSTVFICQAKGDPPITYEWFKMVGGIRFPAGGRKSKHGLLQISVGTKKEIGEYVCLAKDPHRSNEGNVELLYPEQPEMDLPEEFVIMPGGPINISCVVRASARVDSLQWPLMSAFGLFAGFLSKTDDVLLSGHKATATLRIGTNETDIRASGNYSCQATVRGASFSKSTYIRVEGGAKIDDYSPKSVKYLFLGSTSNLTCTSSGIPEPKVTWHFENSPMASGKDTVITNTRGMRGTFAIISTLQIVNLTTAMTGNYTCHVANEHNKAHVDFTILRKGTPAAPLLALRDNQDGQFIFVVKPNTDHGGAPTISYTVTYQLFPQGQIHSMTAAIYPEGVKHVNSKFQVYLDGGWHGICAPDGHGAIRNLQVACRALGYRSVGVNSRSRTGHTTLVRVSCRGSEASIMDCSPRISQCSHEPIFQCTGIIAVSERIVKVTKISRRHAHYVAVRGNNALGTGEPAEILVDM